MAFEPLVWYCQPKQNEAWTKLVDGAFGAYTPCAIDSGVLFISHLVLLGLCCYRIWLIKKNSKVQRFSLSSEYYCYILGFLAGYCTVEPVLRLLMRSSIFNLNGTTGLAPYEVTSLIIEATTWCSVLIMIGLETKSFFYALYLTISTVFCQVLFGILLLVYFPNLHLSLGYLLIESDSLDDEKYEPLSGGEQICPERHASIISRIFFGWITPLMQQDYKRPITEKDVWKLDPWDQTEILIHKFHRCWEKEAKRSKPWLLRALNSSLGGRFWFGGVFKIGYDLCKFAGPMLLNHLLQSMQQGDPEWVGYIYAFLMFLGVLCAVLLEGQYMQNVWRVGFRLCSTLVAAIFHKSLRLTHESRKNFPSGKITNMITADATALQILCMGEELSDKSSQYTK